MMHRYEPSLRHVNKLHLIHSVCMGEKQKAKLPAIAGSHNIPVSYCLHCLFAFTRDEVFFSTWYLRSLHSLVRQVGGPQGDGLCRCICI
jgi:hypothetical protein